MIIDPTKNRRILVIDDNRSIHEDFRKILKESAETPDDLAKQESAIFGEAPAPSPTHGFEVDSAYQGQEGLDLIEKSLEENRPYAMAFVDVQMPPGWDGVETTAKIWQRYSDLQVVICTAYSNYSWAEMLKRLGYSDRLVILKKPFDAIEVTQLAVSMTEKWRLYQQTKLHLDELEKIVQERTRKLEAANAELTAANRLLLMVTEKAQKMAEEALMANRAKGEFLATMSHEIRNPMNGVIGIVNFLLETDLTPEQREFASIIKVSAETLLSTLNDILDFSKIEAGMMTSEKVAFNLHDAVKGAVGLLILSAQSKGLSLTFSFKQDARTNLVGDPTRVRQILINLLSNAIKFTAQGGVSLEIAPVDETDKDVQLRFTVQDTGIGMSEEALKKLFQPFSQADASTTRKFGGTGLGLAISRKLVELMGGTLVVTSALQKGSTFSFTLRFPKQEAGTLDNRSLDAAAESSAKVHPTAPLLMPAGTRVLLAEDGRVNQIVAVRLLQQIGCAVDIVGDGLEAVESWKKHRHRIVIMDCHMPRMDGYEATRLIRELETKQNSKPAQIVALTGSFGEGDRELCLAAGMNDYTTKPVSKHSLETVLRKAVVLAFADDDYVSLLTSMKPSATAVG